jgi:hypothetical protein
MQFCCETEALANELESLLYPKGFNLENSISKISDVLQSSMVIVVCIKTQSFKN